MFNNPHESGTFLTIHEPILTHLSSKVIVHNSVHLGGRIVHGFGQMDGDMYPPYDTEKFHTLKIFISLVKGLSVLFIFSKNQPLVVLIFYIFFKTLFCFLLL